jgi:CubicO group peptidase (beta-lactamase class C family)
MLAAMAADPPAQPEALEPAALRPTRRSWCTWAAAVAGAPSAVPAAAPQADDDAWAALQRAVDTAITAARLPGALLWVERDGQAWHRAFGQRALVPTREPMRDDTVLDVASLTKPVIVGTLAMQLFEQGSVDPDEPVRRLLPEIAAEHRISWRHLLTHSSGLPAGLPLEPAWSGADAALALASRQRPTHVAGTHFRYSDVNYILLGVLIERATGLGLAQLAHERVLQPLGMADSGYLPLARLPAARIAPTEFADAAVLRGVVHDPTARRMGGVAGHAGLFATLPELARYARMVLAGGTLDGQRVLRRESVARMLGNQSPAGVGPRRGFGWDIDSPYSRPRGQHYPVGGVGHTGYTGCAMWIDPGSNSFYVFLSNRVHPHGGDSIVSLYEQVGTLAAQAVGL